MEKILTFLSGKKGTIASLIGTITAYCAAQGYLDTNTTLLIGSVTTILFGAASVATKNLYKNK